MEYIKFFISIQEIFIDQFNQEVLEMDNFEIVEILWVGCDEVKCLFQYDWIVENIVMKMVCLSQEVNFQGGECKEVVDMVIIELLEGLSIMVILNSQQEFVRNLLVIVFLFYFLLGWMLYELVEGLSQKFVVNVIEFYFMQGLEKVMVDNFIKVNLK